MAANISKEDVIEFISGMTVLELSDFERAGREIWGNGRCPCRGR